ncbi:MAG: hypothetical protein KF734_16045 [Saprospiraceae bacterium]|nr:hypothetical protein [Saprospiraceae bacterium]
MNLRVLICIFSFFMTGDMLIAQCPPLGSIVGATQLCTNEVPFIYSVPNSTDAGLVWTVSVVPPAGNFQVTFIGPPTGQSVNLSLGGNPVSGSVIHLCATPTNPCYDPTPICFDIIPPPHLDVIPQGSYTVCEGDEVVFEWQGPQGQTYTWTSLANGMAIGAPQQGSGDLIFTAQNPTDMPLFGGGQVTSWLGNCRGVTNNWSGFVLPKPTMLPPPDLTVCGGAPVSVTFSGTPFATFTWTNDNPAIGLPASGTGNINYTSPKVPAPQTATITVTPQYTNQGVTCPGDPVTFQITLNGSVVDAPPNITVCPGEPVSIAFSGTGNSYTWTNSNTSIGLPASGSGDLSFAANGSPLQQTATITVTPQPCPFASQTFSVTVLPEARVNQPDNVTVCGGQPVAVFLSGSLATTFNWTNSNPAIGLPASGSGSLIAFAAPNLPATQTATVTVTPTRGACTGEPVTFQITVQKCCATDAGTLDTAAIAVCGPKMVALALPGNHHLEPNDTIRFILYSNPANPLGSIVQYSDTLFFPFLPGIMHLDSTYYAAAIAGNQLANDSIDTADPCLSLAKGPKIRWLKKPTIAVGSPPDAVCSAGCVDVQFDFTGTPPFEFAWLVVQNGQILLARNETSAAHQLVVTLCPADFAVPPALNEYVNFRVNFFQDKWCGCGD